MIRAEIDEHNAEQRRRAIIAMAIGLATLFAMFIVLAVACFAIFGFQHWLLIAAGIILLFAVVGARVANRGHDPLSDIAPINDADAVAIGVTWALIGVPAMSPRHAVAGFAEILIHGPRCLIESRALFRAMLPTDQPTVLAASAALESLAQHGTLAVSDIKPPRVVLLLFNLGLIKPERSPSNSPRVTITIKCQELAAKSLPHPGR